MTEADLAKAWTALAAKERAAHARQWRGQGFNRSTQASQQNGRQGAAVALAKREGETPRQKACSRAMFRARNHPPLRTRDLVTIYGLSETFARRVVRQLHDEKRIKQVGQGPQGEKLWEAV